MLKIIFVLKMAVKLGSNKHQVVYEYEGDYSRVPVICHKRAGGRADKLGWRIIGRVK